MKPNHLIIKWAALPAAALLTHAQTAVAANSIVTTLGDTHVPGLLSLREAVAASVDPANTIGFDGSVTGTIVLTSSELLLSQNLVIQGPGAKTLTIAASSSRIFNIAAPANVSISGLTVSGRQTLPSGTGGGILNAGNLSLIQCQITGCSATGSGGNPGEGGGVYSSGSLGMIACTISYCRATAVDGTSGSGLGGGLYITGSLALTNCTLHFNEATGGLPNGLSLGGALYCDNNFGASRVIVNCIVSGNQAGNVGHFDSGAEGGDGGGIVANGLGNLHLMNCILLGNYNVCCSEDVRSRESVINGKITSLGGNLFCTGEPYGSGYQRNSDGSIDFLASSVDPVRLGVFKDRGGPTLTMSIGRDGPAFDNGNDLVVGPPYNLTADQRGFARLVGAHVDIGAYELGVFSCFTCSTFWLGGSGRWDFSSAWNGGASGAGSSAFVTNSGTKTITMDNFTSTNFMSVSNLWVSAPTNSVNTLLVNAGLATPFRIQDNLFVLRGGALTVSNSTVQMNPDNPLPTNAFANDSSVVFDGPATFVGSATLDAANAFDLTIGNSAPGSLAMTNSALNAYDMFVGAGSSGTASFNNTHATLNRSLFIGTAAGQTGIVNIVGGTFTATNSVSTNSPSLVFERGTGQMTISSGATVRFGSALLGSFQGSAGLTLQSGNLSFAGPLQLANGTLSVAGGTLNVANTVSIDGNTDGNLVAQVNVTGGTLNCTNGPLLIGPRGLGQMTISNGTVNAQQIKLGGTTTNSSGTLRLAGTGTLKVQGIAGSGEFGIVENLVVQDGGTLDASQTSIVIGLGHNAQYNVSGGTAIASKMFVGYTPGFTGTYTQSGGTMTVTNNLTVGDCVSNAVGVATLSGSGVMYVTNSSHTATLIVRNGTFTMNGGTLVVDTLIVTNSCGHFLKNSGTLIYNQLILDPNLDADGDGILNGYEQAYGFDPLSPSPSVVVINNNDNGAGSLRQAIANAGLADIPTITFATNVPAQSR